MRYKTKSGKYGYSGTNSSKTFPNTRYGRYLWHCNKDKEAIELEAHREVEKCPSTLPPTFNLNAPVSFSGHLTGILIGHPR